MDKLREAIEALAGELEATAVRMSISGVLRQFARDIAVQIRAALSIHGESGEKCDFHKRHPLDDFPGCSCKPGNPPPASAPEGWRGPWISVKVEMPKPHEDVWCFNRDGFQFKGRVCYGMHEPFFTYPHGEGSPSNTVPNWIDVTHWMPLPEKPGVLPLDLRKSDDAGRLREACQALLDYEDAMDGADGCGENDDMYWKAVRLAREAIEHHPVAEKKGEPT
jgi:hypothetical protein